MATQEQIEYISDHLQQSHPAAFLKSISDGNAGICAVLRILYEATDDVTAGDLSEFMHVSTARIAVLLRKMSEKGLVIRQTDAKDARITIVRLSERGEQTAQRMQNEMYRQIGAVIDSVGMERMLDFIAISNEIKATLVPPKLTFDCAAQITAADAVAAETNSEKESTKC